MKVNDPNLLGPGGLASTGVSKPAQTGRTGAAGAPVAPAGDSGDGVELSGLAQSLRSLDIDSPERQAQVDALAKAYAQGNYKVDADATAGGIIQDALKNQ
ncbi:MAG: flagellar biosynthesis anti-sigma factor FlgM [Bryobacteraceae bacterium]